MQLHQGCSWGSVWIRRRESASAHQSAPPSCRKSQRIPRRPPERTPPLRSPAGQPATTSSWPTSPLQEGGRRGRPQRALGLRVRETVWSSHTCEIFPSSTTSSCCSSCRPPPVLVAAFLGFLGFFGRVLGRSDGEPGTGRSSCSAPVELLAYGVLL
jgi:hypothetical protein